MDWLVYGKILYVYHTYVIRKSILIVLAVF